MPSGLCGSRACINRRQRYASTGRLSRERETELLNRLGREQPTGADRGIHLRLVCTIARPVREFGHQHRGSHSIARSVSSRPWHLPDGQDYQAGNLRHPVLENENMMFLGKTRNGGWRVSFDSPETRTFTQRTSCSRRAGTEADVVRRPLEDDWTSACCVRRWGDTLSPRRSGRSSLSVSAWAEERSRPRRKGGRPAGGFLKAYISRPGKAHHPTAKKEFCGFLS